MTTSSICELFGFAQPRSRKDGSASTASGWKMACALLVLCAATTISPAQTYRTLVSFNLTNGDNPAASLAQGLDGDFYGTTAGGGVYGNGTVFKITRGGMLMTLYSFCAQTNAQGSCTDGDHPWAGLVQGSDGNFYGTTYEGGAYGNGTVFEITPAGALTTLHDFNGTDGANPLAVLVQATDGNFYGTTSGGAYGAGTVFKITPAGTLTTLWIFCKAGGPCTDGGAPWAGLVQGTDGNFYGTTAAGGAQAYNGTVFEITPAGALTTLHDFNGEDGVAPWTGLVQGSDGNFYGTTVGGGGYDRGTVFKVTPSGTLTKLHTFRGTDGSYPRAGLVQATDGNFYGTTWAGGSNTGCSLEYSGCGTIFKITPGGTLTVLHSFPAIPTDGTGPQSGLVQGTDGTFYGATYEGGAYGGKGVENYGTIFSLCVGLGWFTEELPNYGTVGATIDILGTKLTGASYVTFNGIAAPFTVVSPTLIQATVPPGATTGYVRVMLPSGRIPSNKKFRVTPQITSFTPASGPAGTLVTITGVSLTQTWEVTIRGVHASFTVVDDDTVTATVPTGATTGTIRVTGPGGGATSTTNFTVD